ncbi:hypothetical protein BKK79_02495 [Cupriavidus sp. USMAA2-4]|uniref:diguanylate cyclase n=1 Tax=Cupriavidus malaysiensis TaxID=367825 RepID=A0ABM6F486_9BURK|nr:MULTISPECIES: GGDEF domain-containing protein [Cupriavidus]AOY90808.1 hypothetical protein BKK79_02495 [Cupriavidus sp. USMAA2-4]AOY99591.1 hypothetical protein BKK81_10195 [Cupriavidus sp. USMAHM13]AOZ06239.1 hypothetical protein BKK80_10635 [Cupriavidus malaysiensis]
MLLCTGQALALGNPAVALIFSSCCLVAWACQRTHRYLLSVCAAFFLYGLAATSQVFWPPRDFAWNTMPAGLLYACSTVLLQRGMLLRAGARFDAVPVLAVALLQLAALAYFHFIDPHVVARTYIHNGAAALVLLSGAARLGKLRHGRQVDRVLYWIFLLFAFSFVPRLVLNLLSPIGKDPCAFSQAPYWLFFLLGQALLNVALSLAIFAAAVSDVFDALRSERDTDALTQLRNRRGFENLARQAIPPRGGRPLSLVLADIDHFKRINDAYGHTAGDAVLAGFGAVIAQCVRQRDVAARIGGEEFAVLLADTDAAGAGSLAERLRRAFETMPWPMLPASERVTASFGVAALEDGEGLDALLKRTDALLYAAKRGGRNAVASTLDAAPGTLAHSSG